MNSGSPLPTFDDLPSSQPEYALRICGVTKRYALYNAHHDRLKEALHPLRRKYHHDFYALREVSFDVLRGETVGIIGQNGSGKSTLLSIISGVLSPTTGSVETRGKICSLLELGTGFNPELTGVQNIFLSGAIQGLSREQLEQKLDSIVAFADIGEFIHQPVKLYSSGMYVRLAFAIQASIDPDILIVDEALAVGDAYFVHKCMLRFKDLQQSGTTILLVSHDATAIKTLCSRAVWLDRGNLAAVGPASTVVDRYLAATYKQTVVLEFGHANGDTTQDRAVDSAAAGDAPAHPAPLQNHETSIPNIDRRTGDQRCTVLGIGLYDHTKRRSNTVWNRARMTLRVTIANHTLTPGTPLTLGCSLRNSRGVDIASNNSEIEGVQLCTRAPSEKMTIRIGIDLPELHPGSYALSVELSARDTESGQPLFLDCITNAVVFNVLSERAVHVLMALPTSFEVE